MKYRLPSLLLLSAATAFSGVALADKADRGKPMNIEADALRHDELKQTSVFTGHVIVTKGTMVLRGAQVEVRQDADGYQFGVATAESGKRAFFRQKRDTPPGAPDEFIEGEGEVIEYDGRNDTVRFIRRAELRRYRNATLSDEVSGAVIIYNNLTDLFTVDGQPQGGGASRPAGAAPAAGGRVRAMLSPKEPPAAVPAKPASAPALRPSQTLENP